MPGFIADANLSPSRLVSAKDAAQQAIDRGVRVYTIGFGNGNAFGALCYESCSRISPPDIIADFAQYESHHVERKPGKARGR